MSAEIIIPHMGATGGDVRIVSWLVKPGDAIDVGTPLATIETDKATEDLESAETGFIEELLVPEGSDVAIGTVIAKVSRTPVSRPTDNARDRITAPEKNQLSFPQHEAKAPAARSPIARDRHQSRIFASPAARRLARSKGIDLAEVKCNATGGAIHVADVNEHLRKRGTLGETHASKSAQPALRPPVESRSAMPAQGLAARAEDSHTLREPLSKMRRAIARQVTASKAEIPHFYVTQSIDMTAAIKAQEWLAEPCRTSTLPTPTLNDIVMRAAALALQATPDLNVVFEQESILKFSSVDLGLVIATSSGVVIPVLRNVPALSIYDLAAETRTLKERAASGAYRGSDFAGGAMSITNLGMFGVEQFTAVINPGQSSILACGVARPEPIVVESQVVVRTMMKTTLSVDHRVADGVLAAEFLRKFKRLLEMPQLLLLQRLDEGIL